MRDYLILAIILGSVPFCFFKPYLGVLMWSWISYFNPHRFAYGIAYNFPVAEVIAVPTLLGAIFTRDRNKRIFTRETVLLLMFWLWTTITFLNAANEPLFADHVADATQRLIQVSKIMLMTVLSIYLVTSKKNLKYLLMVTALSLGVLGLKGAIFGVLTGGQFRVWGPPNSFIADNNDFGLALNMTLPMLFFLARDEKNRTLRLFFMTAFVSGAASSLLTYSRGALLGVSAVMAAIALKSRYKILSGGLIAVTAFLVISFAPGAWMSRMQNFANGNLDASAEERLTSWQFAWNFATHYPLMGGGFECFTPNLFAMYSPRDPKTWLAGHTSSGPHSIYFQVLAEQGFVGFGLFVCLLLSCFLSARKLRKRARRNPVTAWVATYSHIIEVSLLAYMVSGAFLGRAYFDLYFQLVAILTILKLIYQKEVSRAAFEPKPAAVIETQLEQVLA